MADDKDDTIHKLRQILSDREKDLTLFRTELAKANKRLEALIEQSSHQLKLAKQVQQTLVPREFPHIPGFEFSTKFLASAIRGGDYYDIFEHADKYRFGILLASCSGYSMSSLLLSVLLRMTTQLQSKKSNQPSEMLEQINAQMAETIVEKDSANIFYGILDRRRFTMTYASAGEIVGLIQRADTGNLESLQMGEVPLQKGRNGAFQNHVLNLSPLDRVVLCTDGVVQRTNEASETFGKERIFKAILASAKGNVHDIRNEILFQNDRFAQNKEAPHDMTVIAVEVKKRIVKLARVPDDDDDPG